MFGESVMVSLVIAALAILISEGYRPAPRREVKDPHEMSAAEWRRANGRHD
jgi:hypothetical protein